MYILRSGTEHPLGIVALDAVEVKDAPYPEPLGPGIVRVVGERFVARRRPGAGRYERSDAAYAGGVSISDLRGPLPTERAMCEPPFCGTSTEHHRSQATSTPL
jgi:hypothetical protein